MTSRALVAAAAVALLLGAASGARITGRWPYWLSSGGGVTLYVRGEDFSEDQFSQFDPTLGNRVSLVNEEDEIECEVIQYLTNTNEIVCSTGPRTNEAAPLVYQVVVHSDGVKAEGSASVQYAWWIVPKIRSVTPLWSLPGQELKFEGNIQTNRYYQVDLEDPLENDLDRGHILTKVFMGGVECAMTDEDGELLGTFDYHQLTCLPGAKLIGAMNTSLYVKERGASIVENSKLYVDSQDKLFQYHSYPAINNVSPSSGSRLGGTLITVDGIGFDPYLEQTKVEVGGVLCSVQEVTDDQIKCLTPNEEVTASPSSGERGILVELFRGQTATNSEFWTEETWAALDSSHSGYESFVSSVPELSFPLEISEDTLGRVRAFLHPPHDGHYFIFGNAGNAIVTYVAADGNPENAVIEQPIELQKGTPAYVEVRFRAESNTDFKLRMKDFNTMYNNKQTYRAIDDRQQVKIKAEKVLEKQMVTIAGVSTPVTLFMNGVSSAPVDISDSAAVREQLLDMTEQKCEMDLTGMQIRHHTNFEDDTLTPGIRGELVDDLPPFCGRKSFKLYRNDPRVYRETNENQMVDANTHRYLCVAVTGKLQTRMAINFVWRDNNGKRRDDTFWFDSSIPPNGWVYHCEDLQQVILNSWAATQYTAGARLLVKNVVLPKPEGPLDEVYVDEVIFASDAVAVLQSRPSAVKQQGILVTDVRVEDETENGYMLRFITSNCMAGYPLLGVFDGEADNSFINILSSSESYNFPIGDGSVTVTRDTAAIKSFTGTWGLSLQGREVKDIPSDVHEIVLESYLESALGTDMGVSFSGDCWSRRYSIKWLMDPGRKEMMTVDDTNLVFDGELTVSVNREVEGMIWHDPLAADFMTAYRDTPHVTLRVNGYSAACLGDCSFTYVEEGSPVHTSSQIPNPSFTEAVTYDVIGQGFTSSDPSDYGVSLGDAECTPISVDNSVEEMNKLEVECDIPVAGTYPYSVRLQPYGTFFSDSKSFSPVVSSLSQSEGPMTGYYPITVYGAGFPSDTTGWEADGSYIKIDQDYCEVITGGPTEVTCMVPPHEAGSDPVDVEVSVNDASSSFTGFTYTAVSEVPTISSLSSSSLSVLGDEELMILGAVFGSDAGTVKIGSEPCKVSSWSENSVTCTTPSLAPGSYKVSLLTDGLGMAEADVEYLFSVTSASKLKGSVKGGTTVTLKGLGFGSNCSLLKVKLGEEDECEVLECQPTSLTCVTRLIPTTHEVTNTGINSEGSVAWFPPVLDVREGDTVIWKWSKVSENSQLQYSVCQVPDPMADCGDDDGTGFNSGPKTEAGLFATTFNHHGIYHYAGLPMSSAGLTMRGQINVIRPESEARKISVLLGGQEATINLSDAEEPITGDGCSANQEPLADCTVPDLFIPDDGFLYFQAHTCYTPVVTQISTDPFTGVPGLSGIQLIEGVNFNVEGSGFNDESVSECKTEVSIGDSPCAVSTSTDTQVTCVPNLEGQEVSYYPVTVQVFGNGIAAVELANYNSEGRVVVVPYVASFSPTEGSLGGGTLLTITGSGLQGLSAQPSMLLGGQACTLQDVSPTSVTCLTPPSDTATTASLTVTVLGIEAILSESLPSFTYNEALTPVLTEMTVTGETATLTGQNFGSDSSKLLVTLKREESTRQERDVETENKEEEEVMMEIDEDYIEDFLDDDEMEDIIGGYIDELDMSTTDAVRMEKGRRHLRDSRPKLTLADIIEAPEGFWGTFTGTGAKTFKESVLMGAWRTGGTRVSARTDGDGDPIHVEPKRKKRSAEDLPATYQCVITSVSETEASCTVAGLPAGTYIAEVVLDGAGLALQDGLSATAEPVISSISPLSGSVNGGALLTILGSGFIDGDTSVMVGDSSCPIETVSSEEITCRLPQGTDGSAVAVVVAVTGSSDITAASTFAYDSAVTPSLDSMTPTSLTGGGTSLTLTGSNFKQGGADPEVLVGGAACAVVSATDTEIECTAPELPGGNYNVVVREATVGDSNALSLQYESGINSADLEGSFGGSLITISGFGFDPAGDTTVTVCDNPCEIVGTSTATELSCIVPAEPFTGVDKSCDLKVILPDGTTVDTMTFQYLASKTSFVTDVSPKRGGTAGGTIVTITGNGFGSSESTVTIGGSACDVQSWSPTSITCRTSDHSGPGEFPVLVDVPNNGFAVTDDNGIFFYIDRWSSVFTWGNEPVPSAGQLVQITEGQTVLIDESTPVLKMLLVDGGHVVFDVEASDELVLRAEYILIVGGGSLSIGSEEEPFPGEAVIELHGNTQSIELPIYGAKVMAVRHGTLDLHGAHVPITWTYLEETVSAGASSITLVEEVTWKAGDQIVIASTGLRFSVNDNEVRTIQSVSNGGRTLTFAEPLEHEHIAITQTLAGQEVSTRAEVGLLTRNVKIRGAINEDFTEFIEGCEDKFNPNQFATQTCFNGRYGDEIATDQFGATVMLAGKEPDQELVMGRIEYVEVTEAGQAFQLGRYPLHFHLVGNVDTSYIRGCAVHRTYNRAITIHAANFLTVERNVVYNNLGHAIFTEDGVEQNNVIQYNLAVFTRTSSSLLNVDITPASFWVVNPNNIVRHNAAAGGTHFGYWYRTERHPSGPSSTNEYCPNNEQMGQFFNNTAHSIGRYGLWVFSMQGYHPTTRTCRGNDLVAKWEDFTVWHCERGAEVVFGTNLQFHNFVALNNKLAGMEMVKMKGGNRVAESPGIFNSLVACHSDLGNEFCTSATSGIVVPKMFKFSISGVTFVNFDVAGSSALSGCSQCKPRQGGFTAQVEGLSFVSSPNKLKFLWEHETIWHDEDGTLGGTAGGSVVPWMDILPADSCSTAADLSVNSDAPGAVCSSDMRFLRYNIKGPSIEPPSLQGRALIVTNEHGSVTVPYKAKRLTTAGWMGILFTGDTYQWDFEDSSQITNKTYQAETRHVGPGDYYYVKHQLMQEPDFFGTLGEAQESENTIPDPSTGFHGDYYWDSDNKEITYMVSYNEGTERNLREFTSVAGTQRDIEFSVYRNAPTPPPVPTGRPDAVFLWSDVETWKEVPVGSGGHPTEEEYNLPVEGDEIIIPPGMWLVVDTVTPKLGQVRVYGTLEFDDTMDHYFEATVIYIQGGLVVAGFSADDPFTHQLEIQLRGSIDPNDPDNVEFPTPSGVPNVGWKAIGVFGSLKLHGTVSGKSWHKLGATAEAGSSSVTLADTPDASWLNKMVVLSTTSKESVESEIRTVVAIDSNTLTLDTALEFEHLGVTHTFDDGTSVTLAGEVGLLSRNIVVRGSPTDDSFGGRIMASRVSQDGVDYVGLVQLDGVLLENMGQESFTSLDDPRYSLAIIGLGTVEEDSTYITRSSFSINYNVALGLFDTSNVKVEDNVIYFALDSGVRDESGLNTYRNNLITTVLFLGTYGDRSDKENLNWYGAFHLDNAPNTVLEGNVVAGAEQAGFKTYGEICEADALWQNNEVHSTIYGVMSWKKNGAGIECRKIHSVYAWRISDTAFYVQHYASSVIENVVSVDSPLGVNQLIIGPPALTHNFADKFAITKASVFVGASPSHTCTFQRSTSEILTFYSGKLWKDGVNGGNTAVVFGTFMSSANLAPKMSFPPAGGYPALHGRTDIEDNKFISYKTRSCGTNVALMANPGADGAVHPIFVSGLSFVDTPNDNYVFIPRADVRLVNPSDCVDMDCDGLKKVVLKDKDGTLLGTASATLTSEAEYEWDGDERRGVGDYRIPVSLKQKDDGTQILADQKFPNKGIVRNDICTLVAPWQAWSCESLLHFMMVIESMDTDTEVRRLSPIALIANPGNTGYVDLLNGPKDVGWCFGYTCQERISTFYAVLAHEQVYEMAMTSTPPQVLRLHPLTYADEVVVLRMFFPKLQRYDVYVGDTYVPPTNIDTSATKYQLIPENPDDPTAFFPTVADPVGSNYLQRSAKLLHVVVGKAQLVTIRTTPMITLSSGLVVSNDEFFEENLLQNLVDLFGLSAENIRVTNIVPEDSRRGLTRQETMTMDVSAEIGSAPTSSLGGSESAIGSPVLSYDQVVGALQTAVNTYQEGKCKACKSFESVKPNDPPPAEAPPKATEEEGSVVIEGAELFSNKQQKEEEAALNKSMETVEFSKPASAEVLTGVPTYVLVNTAFNQQPSITVLDEEGEVVNELGFETDPWRFTATLVSGPEGGVLEGTTTVPYMDGAATFTDLAVSEPGEGYSLSFTLTHPSDAPPLTVALDTVFSAREEIPMVVNVALPEGLLHAEQPISLSVQLIDEDSGDLLDGTIFEDHVIMGELLEKRGLDEEATVIERFHQMFTSNAEIPIELTLDQELVRYQLFARVSIVPGEWYLEGETSRLVVYPSDVQEAEGSITEDLQMELFRNKRLPDVEMQLEDGVLQWLMDTFDMAERSIIWGPVTVEADTKKISKANLQISGPSEQVETTIAELCQKLKPRVMVKVRSNCRVQAYRLRKVYVDGTLQRCRRARRFPKTTSEKYIHLFNSTQTVATERNIQVLNNTQTVGAERNTQVLNNTQTVMQVGRHKFNRG